MEIPVSMPLYLQSIQIPQTGNSFTPLGLPCRKKRQQGYCINSTSYDAFCIKTPLEVEVEMQH